MTKDFQYAADEETVRYAYAGERLIQATLVLLVVAMTMTVWWIRTYSLRD